MRQPIQMEKHAFCFGVGNQILNSSCSTRGQYSLNTSWRANLIVYQGFSKNNESQMDRYHNSMSVWFSAEFEK